MYNPQPIPLTAEQIDRIHAAAFIIREEDRLEKQLATDAIGWFRGDLNDVDFSVTVRDYILFKETYPTLPI